MSAPVRRLDASWDFTFGRGRENYIDGQEAIAQRIKSRLLLILGEWFLDTGAGVPWFQPEDSSVRPIMGGPRDLSYAEAVLKAQILGTDGVRSLESFEMSFDPRTRMLLIDAVVTTDDGDALTVSLEGP
jgi:hypothetical protein